MKIQKKEYKAKKVHVTGIPKGKEKEDEAKAI